MQGGTPPKSGGGDGGRQPFRRRAEKAMRRECVGAEHPTALRCFCACVQFLGRQRRFGGKETLLVLYYIEILFRLSTGGRNIRENAMKTIYILLTRSGTLLSNLVYTFTGANYTHASIAFDEDLSCLYSSTRKNGYTMFPAGPSREYLNRGVFKLRGDAPCALYALKVSEEAYCRAKRRADHMMAHGRLYRFNTLGLLLCGLHIRWNRRRHYFCSQFVSEVLEKSGSMELPKHSTLMHPNDYTRLEGLECLYQGQLNGLPQRQKMDLGQEETVVSVYLGLMLGFAKDRVRRFF